MCTTDNKVWQSLEKLMRYVEAEQFKGYDPYDALNSKILRVLSFRNKWLRIAFTQGLKKFPLNLRPLLLIEKGYNPKGLGLFLTGYLKLYSLYGTEKYLQKINHIISILDKIKSDGYSGYCWGYNFDWQSKSGFIPEGTPTIVNTTFIAHAFLDAYQLLGEKRFLEIARSSGDFILDDLYISKANNFICFSYTPFDKSKVHNANMLGASLLARLYSFTREDRLLAFAKNAAGYVTTKQRPDGSWYYAETNYQRWIDCHHTGFVIESLFNYISFTRDRTHSDNLKKGLEFLKNHFFLKSGMTKFYYNRNYPVDIHCLAQAIVTLVVLKDICDNSKLLQKVVYWMINHMQDDRGYFYYRKGRLFYNKIPYIRWSQAWAFHALTTYYLHLRNSPSG